MIVCRKISGSYKMFALLAVWLGGFGGLAAAEAVSSGSTANQLIYQVQNSSSVFAMPNVVVEVLDKPAWITFSGGSSATIGAVPPGGSGNATLFFDVAAGSSGSSGFIQLRVLPGAGDEWTSTAYPELAVEIVSDPKVFAAVTVLLEGPFGSGSMATTLADNNLLPLNQPYNVAPWGYGGQESVAQLPAGTVDWVYLELRNTADGTEVAARRAALLTAAGAVVDTNGAAMIGFQAPAGNYYLVVRHRNHLAIMTPTAIALSEAGSSYDFSTGQSKAIGLNPMRELTGGLFGMISGDANSDGGVDVLDLNLHWRPNKGTTWDYGKYADFNLDGGIDVLDLNLYWRPNKGLATQLPAPAKMQR